MTQAQPMIDPDVREQDRAEDLRLLRRYADQGDADAFRLVARRYLDFVYTACPRELLNPSGRKSRRSST